jgi:hypothetical protein
MCVPILTEEESLKSIIISELDLPTEASLLEEKQISEPEKAESFGELIEKYDDLYIKNISTALVVDDDGGEIYLQKRSSNSKGEAPPDKKVGKSIIEKLATLADPEVRKEFELELSKTGSVKNDVNDNSSSSLTEYEPDYSQKIVNGLENNDRSTKDLHVDDAEESLTKDYTTTAPEGIAPRQVNVPEIIEVIEQVYSHPENFDDVQPTTDLLNIQVDFEPIQIVQKNHDHFRNINFEETTVTNDKFVGYQPSDDLVEPGEETTERDNFFKRDETENSAVKAAEEIIETMEFIGIFGKSLNIDDTLQIEDIETPLTVIPEYAKSTTQAAFEPSTEIVETRTEISVNIVFDETSKIAASNQKVTKGSSSSDRSSEESSNSKSNEKNLKFKIASTESSEENSAKEIIDTNELRVQPGPLNATQNVLMEELYKETMNHEVIKKDHPTDLRVVGIERKFDSEIEASVKADEQETTTVGVYETIEEVVSTFSDAIKLTGEFRSSIDSFRGYNEENETILDTNSEAISSKNIKTSLVNIAEEMTLENYINTSSTSYIVVSVLGVLSLLVIVSFFITLIRKSSRIMLF